MVAAVFNDDDDLTTFLDQFDDVKDIEEPVDNLIDLFPAIWTEQEEEDQPSSKFDNNRSVVPDLSLQEALITESRTDVSKMRLFAKNQLRSFSPVSVLSSNPGGSGLPAGFAKTVLSCLQAQGRARTKRCRQKSVNHTTSSHLLQLVPASWTWTDSLDETRKSSMEHKRKITKSKLSSSSEMDQNMNKKPNDVQLEVGTESDRKCTHCEITTTPQWRLGPMGSKTLCNACGVRYKSGRLFPEYRPVASPTFSPSKHSNSHRKVVEMRRKGGKNSPAMDMIKNVKGEENHLVPVSVELIF